MIRVSTQQKGEGVNLRVDRFEKSLLNQISSKVVDLSPVETGAYMDSHTWAGEPGQSSDGRPGGQSESQFASAAKTRLSGQVEGHQAGSDETLSNSAPHAWNVEHEHGHAPYKQAARELNNFLRSALTRARGGI